MLNFLPDRDISILAKYEIPKKCSMSDVLQAQNRKQSHANGLAILLKAKVNARIMVTTKTDSSGSLINSQVGTVKFFCY